MPEITKQQMQRLKKHEKHHTKEHMNFMKSEMRKGVSFTAAHKKAMSKLGK
tara:strand:- start:11323 stop:11475 length:153 start_codon:yes stop_codon:yes gene_type:complete